MPDLNDSLVASGRVLDFVDSIESPDYIQFDTTADPAGAEGRLIWSTGEGTLEVGLEGGNVNLPIGAKTVIYVKNATGSVITKGSGVMAVGSAGDRISVGPAIANGSVSARYMLGVAAEDIVDDSLGYVVTNGYIRNLNTNSYAVGTILYFDPTTPGALTSTEPQSPNIELPIAIVTRQHATSGILYVRMVNNLYLNEVHDVLINTATAGDVLTYNGSLWVNQPAASGASVTIADTAPSTPSAGDLWFESDTAKTYVYYDSTWVEIGATSIDVLLNTINAKGDILVGTADDTVGRLSVGINNQILVANSATSTGVQWQTPTFASTGKAIAMAIVFGG